MTMFYVGLSRTVVIALVSMLTIQTACTKSSVAASASGGRASVVQLIEISGEAKLRDGEIELMSQQYTEELRRLIPAMSSQTVLGIKAAVKEAEKVSRLVFVEGIAQLYERHFSGREIQQVLEFRRSEAAIKTGIPRLEIDEKLRDLPKGFTAAMLRNALNVVVSAEVGDREVIVDYYTSPIGRKEVGLMPVMSAERDAVAAEFAKVLSSEVDTRIRAVVLEMEGILLAD
jgi:hypothetical protein